MAVKRMFSHSVISTDKFLDLPHECQLLYFTLGMNADDDGFVANPRRLNRLLGCSDESFEELIRLGYLIRFPSGIIVITHWRVNNTVKSDRYKRTACTEEAARLTLDSAGIYHLRSELDPEVDFFWNHFGASEEKRGEEKREEEVSREEVSREEKKKDEFIAEESEERYFGTSSAPKQELTLAREEKKEFFEDSVSPKPEVPVKESVPSPAGKTDAEFVPPTVQEVSEYLRRIGHNPAYGQPFVDYYTATGWVMGNRTMKDWKAAARRWAMRENELAAKNAAKAPKTGYNPLFTSAANAARNAQYLQHEPTDYGSMADLRRYAIEKGIAVPPGAK